MTGDGTNDAPALAQADVGVAMNTGTQAAREAGNMVDLDSNPTKLIEIVEVGKQLLITRGALTTFSIANDVAKYFAILPAVFASTYAVAGRQGPLDAAQRHGARHAAVGDRLGDHLQRADHPACSSRSRCAACATGRSARPRCCAATCSSTGVGGLIAPFIGIKLIDLVVHNLSGGVSRSGATRSSSAWPPASARPTGCCRRATPSSRPGATS